MPSIKSEAIEIGVFGCYGSNGYNDGGKGSNPSKDEAVAVKKGAGGTF